MPSTNRFSTKSRRILFGLISLSLFSTVIIAGFVSKRTPRTKPVAPPIAVTASTAAKAKPTAKEPVVTTPQSGAQFDLSRNVIAGGGGTSTGGSIAIDGTVGEPAAGTKMSGGGFAQAGGFWYIFTTPTEATPTPTPTPTGTPAASCALAPQGLVAWYRAEGNADDAQGTSNGVLQGGASFSTGKVGQAFNLNGSGQFVQIPDAPALDPTQQLTLDAWVFPTAESGDPDVLGIIINKERDGTAIQYEMGRKNGNNFPCGGVTIPTGNLIFYLGGVNGLPSDCAGFVDGRAPLPLNAWSHIALTYDGAKVRIYLNGNITREIAASGALPVTNGQLRIGARSGIQTYSPAFWAGKIDEVQIYNRALTPTEIQSIFNADSTGICTTTVSTPVGANVAANLNEVNLNFAQVTAAGTTGAAPIDPKSAGTLPNGYRLNQHSRAYDISTTAKYAGKITVSIILPTIDDAQTFGRMRMFHQEGGVLRNVTIPGDPCNNFNARRVCGSVPSLSPFVVAEKIDPTIATLGGRIATSNDAPLAGVTVTLTNGTDVLRAVTDAQGAYYLTNVKTNATYTLTPSLANYTFSPSNYSFTLTDDRNDAVFTAIADSAPQRNAIDDAGFFVRQHYLDFLNREPDADGFNFWTNQITSCNGEATCIDTKRQNVSAAYFLSREFQETGFYVIKLQRAAFGKISQDASRRISYQQFLTDAASVGRNFVDGQSGADQILDQNKMNYAQSVAASSAFIARFPTSQSATQFVDALYQSAGVMPQGTERQDAINAFGSGDTNGRAASLRKVAESNAVKQAEFNAAFVLLQYFGYLRRNPTDAPDTNDSGYQFWLNKLNSFNGDYIRSEMVRSFIVSTEYRKRFGTS